MNTPKTIISKTDYLLYRVQPPDRQIPESMDSQKPEEFSLKFIENFQFALLTDSELNHRGLNRIKHERLLERIREENYINLPSRLNCVFLFQSLEIAQKFQKSGWTESDGVIVCYEIIETYKPIFTADMAWTNIIPNLIKNWEQFRNKNLGFIKPTLEKSLEEICHLYWQGIKTIEYHNSFSEKHFMPEILLEGQVRKIR